MFWGLKPRISSESRLILLVLLIGAFAACVSALKSIADYRGNEKLYEPWAMFYVVQPTLGAGIAFLFYLVIRGGLLAGTEVDFEATTPYGILAIAALAGMFADKAHLKLSEVFDALFGPKKPDDRRGKLASAFSIKTKMLTGPAVNRVYSAKLEATGGKEPYKWESDTLPAGLALDAKTGAISGTPTTTSPKKPYKFTVTDFTVTDAEGKVATVVIELEVT